MGMYRPAEAKRCGRVQLPNLTQTGGTLWRLGCGLAAWGLISSRVESGLGGCCWFLGGLAPSLGRVVGSSGGGGGWWSLCEGVQRKDLRLRPVSWRTAGPTPGPRADRERGRVRYTGDVVAVGINNLLSCPRSTAPPLPWIPLEHVTLGGRIAEPVYHGMLLVLRATTFPKLMKTTGLFLVVRGKPGQDSNSQNGPRFFARLLGNRPPHLTRDLGAGR